MDDRPFVKMYIDTLAESIDVSHHDLGVLAELAKRMDVNNVVVVDNACKESIANKLGIAVGSVANKISFLLLNHHKPLIRKSFGHYVVNSALYSKDNNDCCENKYFDQLYDKLCIANNEINDKIKDDTVVVTSNNSNDSNDKTNNKNNLFKTLKLWIDILIQQLKLKHI